MKSLLEDWGHIIRLVVNNYNESSTLYIELLTQEEINYLVEALDRTPFEHQLIRVELVD
jgi:hypothetical protein